MGQKRHIVQVLTVIDDDKRNQTQTLYSGLFGGAISRFSIVSSVVASSNWFQMLDGVSCVVQEKNSWFRARLVQHFGSEALIRLADIGYERIVLFDDIYTLVKKFGRLPPLAFESRMAGYCFVVVFLKFCEPVHYIFLIIVFDGSFCFITFCSDRRLISDILVDDLTIDKIKQFQDEIRKCNCIVRVEIVSCDTSPLLVNLYHPTLDYNIGSAFYHRERAKHDLEKKFLKREKKVVSV